MDLLCIIVLLIALGLGFGWWRERRGMAGIKSDLADAKREVEARIKK